MTFSATCGAATLMAAISTRACRLPTVSIIQAVFRVSSRAISNSTRDSAILRVPLPVLVAEHRQPAHDRHARRVERHHEHRLLPVHGAVRVRLAHDD
jgi:hypothetical protein